MDLQTLIFLGPQGCGKGTQVNLLKEYLGKNDPARSIAYFEAGKQLRDFGGEGGHTQDIVDASLRRGELQPDFITLYLLSKFLFASMKDNEHFIVDGFPRTLEQQAIFNGAMKFYKRVRPVVLYLTISDEEAVKRLLLRGRSDDTEAGIRSRLAWTKAQVLPAVEHFRENAQYRFIDIDGERSIEEIHKDILQKLGLQG